MSEKANGLGVYSTDRSDYSSQKEVMRMTFARGARLRVGLLRQAMVLGIAMLAVVGTAAASFGQEEPFVDRVLGALIRISDEDFTALVELMGILDTDEQARVGFLEMPREFLALQEFVPAIEIGEDQLQITGLSFSVPSPDEDEPLFGVAEPLDELTYDSKGIGIFYRDIGIIIQEAIDPATN